MNRIQTNPYRIAGILANATARELQRQRGKIKAFASAKKEITSEFDFNILSKIDRTEEVIEKAFSNIEQNQDKVNNSLFWFVNANPFDNTAIEYLKNGNSEKAQEIWSKVTNGKDVNSSNFSAFNNIGTLKLLSNYDTEIKEGIEAKIKLIESEYFENFVHSVADQTFTIDNKKQSKLLVDELLTQFKNQYSSADTLNLFSTCSSSTQNYLSKKFTEEPLHNIESSIETTKKKRIKNKANAYSIGLKLFVDSKDDLQLLKSLLGSSDLKYKMIADNVAKEVMQCSIDYFNESQENNSSKNYLEEAIKLVKIADSVAVSKLTKDRAKDNLASLVEMIDKEINQAITLLQSIKDAFDKNWDQLQNQVSEQEKILEYGRTINWTKVYELRDNFINWNEVINLIHKVIPPNNINKIKNSPYVTKVNDYKKLVEFVFRRINQSKKIQVQYLQYWESEEKKIIPKTVENPKSPKKTNTDTSFEMPSGIAILTILLIIAILLGLAGVEWAWLAIIPIISGFLKSK